MAPLETLHQLPTIVSVEDTAPHIGRLKEKPLHASLKQWCARPGDRFEVPVDGFVVDLVRGDQLIEVQTSGFSSLKQKLTALLELGRQVHVVHPIPVEKWIVKIADDGTVLSTRRSPKHGAVTDVFGELVSIPDLLTHPNLEIEVVLTREEELRRHSPGQAWRRRGWTVVERRLNEVVDQQLICDAADLAELLPSKLPEPFTTTDLAELLDCPRRTAQQMTYCLRIAGVLTVVGKRGNTLEYVGTKPGQ